MGQESRTRIANVRPRCVFRMEEGEEADAVCDLSGDGAPSRRKWVFVPEQAPLLKEGAA